MNSSDFYRVLQVLSMFVSKGFLRRFCKGFRGNFRGDVYFFFSVRLEVPRIYCEKECSAAISGEVVQKLKGKNKNIIPYESIQTP